MNQPMLPMELPEVQESAVPTSRDTQPREARVVRPVRNQAEMMVRDLESLVAEDHPVRLIWALLSQLDLSVFYSSIKAVVDSPGRPAADPQVLLALWVYATVEGVGSARRLDRLCHEHDAYRWLCGNVPVDYHMLSDFRVAHQGASRHVGTDPDYGEYDGARLGATQLCCPGWGEGEGQCGGKLVPAQRPPGVVSFGGGGPLFGVQGLA